MPNYKRTTFLNDSEIYSFLLEVRDVSFINQYNSKVFSKNLKSLNIQVFNYTWKQGDKLYKLASKFYGSHKLWWIIALTNKISCEADLSYGDVIIIPNDYKQIVENLDG